jgi:hypothetical protein
MNLSGTVLTTFWANYTWNQGALTGGRKILSHKGKGCGAHRNPGQELLRAALRFARVP